MTDADRAALSVLESEIESLEAAIASKKRLWDDLRRRIRAEEAEEHLLRSRTVVPVITGVLDTRSQA